MAGLPGFASHESSLYIGAGCQQWKLLDVSGTQPPLRNLWVLTLQSTPNNSNLQGKLKRFELSGVRVSEGKII